MECYKAKSTATNKEAYILIPDKYMFLDNAHNITGLIYKNSKLRTRYYVTDCYNEYEKITKENILRHIRKLKNILKIFKQYQNCERNSYTDNQLPSVSVKLFYNEFIEFYNQITGNEEEIIEEPELKIYGYNNSYAFEMIKNSSINYLNEQRICSNGLYYDADYKHFTLMNSRDLINQQYPFKPIELYELVFNNNNEILEEVKQKIKRRKKWLQNHYVNPLPQSDFLLIDLYDKIIKLEEKYKNFN